MNQIQRKKKIRNKQQLKQQQTSPFIFKSIPTEHNQNWYSSHSHSKKKLRTQQNSSQLNSHPSHHQAQFTCFEERVPDQVLESILHFLPDKFDFHPNYRSKNSSYGFENQDCFSQPLHRFTSNTLAQYPSEDESEGNHWSTPSTSVRLVNRRWARIGAEVFLKHLSITSMARLNSLAKLFNSDNPNLPRLVRTLVISFKFNQSFQTHQSIRNSFSQLLTRLTSLRSMSIRACPLGLLFPAPLEIKNLFLPPSIVRLAIEFQSNHHSALLGSLSNASDQTNTLRNDGRPTRFSTGPVQLHAAELNLLLVCLPNLRSLHLSGFQSHPQRPLSRYLFHQDDKNSPQIEPESFSSIQSLILTDCHLSKLDAKFISSKFVNLLSLLIFNQFIDSNHISAINHLLSTELEHHPSKYENRLAQNLESLTLKLTDFKFDLIELMNSFPNLTTPNASWSSSLKSHPISPSVVASSLSNWHDPIDLSHLEKIKHLSITTPTRVKFSNHTHDQFQSFPPKLDKHNPELNLFHSLTYLELDSRLLLNSHHHQDQLLSILNKFSSVVNPHSQPIKFGSFDSQQGQVNDHPKAFVKLKKIKIIANHLGENSLTYNTSSFTKDDRNGNRTHDVSFCKSPQSSLTPDKTILTNTPNSTLEPNLISQRQVPPNLTGSSLLPSSSDDLLPYVNNIQSKEPSHNISENQHQHEDCLYDRPWFKKIKLQFICWNLNILWS